MTNAQDFLESLAHIGFGDHLCLIYETKEEQFAAAIPFIRAGLLKNERCVYIADDNTIDAVLHAMQSEDLDLFTTSQKNGQLLLITKTESYLKEGYFHPEKMIGFLKKSAEDAVTSGYLGLRATGEMTWMLAGDPGSEKLMEYEALLNTFFPKANACALCQYNRNRFSDTLLLDVFRTHPLVVYKNKLIENPLYVTPEEFIGKPQKPLVVADVLAQFANS